jgi:hypothetical protein
MNQTWCNATIHLEMEIQYTINSLGVEDNKMKTSQWLHVDLQA